MFYRIRNTKLVALANIASTSLSYPGYNQREAALDNGFELSQNAHTKPHLLPALPRSPRARSPARIRRAHNRWQDVTEAPIAPKVVILEDGTVDLRLGEVNRNGASQRLTTQELDLLRYFASRTGQTVTRDELLRDVWGYQRAVVTRAVHTAVKRLRKKIEIDPTAPCHILTVHGSGYRFESNIADEAETKVDTGTKERSTTPSIATNISRSNDKFVGRATEIAALQKIIEAGAQLVTLTGPGGAGKTRLSREYASLAAERSPMLAGPWFVDCSNANDISMVIHAVAATLGLAPTNDMPTEEEMERIATWLNRQENALIIMDNLEQIVEPARQLISMLTTHAQKLRVIATSRQRLLIDGERVIEVGALTTEEAMDLFVGRARTHHSGFELQADEEQDLATLIQRLDRQPLAIELAAGWARMLRPADMLNRLNARFRLLARSTPHESDRHGTVRATLDGSWDLLNNMERQAFAQLSVFRGGFDLRAAEAVIKLADSSEAPWTPDLLRQLSNCSLLLSEQQETGVRFRMYETIRVYAAQRLKAFDEDAALTRHGDYFLSLANQLKAPAHLGQKSAHETLELELTNILYAYECALTQAPDKALEIVVSLEPACWGLQLTQAELGERIERALSQVHNKRDDHALHGREIQAESKRWHIASEEIESELLEIATIAAESGLELRAASARLRLGRVRVSQGRFQEALEPLQAALVSFRSLKGHDAVYGEVSVLRILAEGYSLRGERQLACECLDDALRLCTEIGAHRDEARIRCQIANMRSGSGNYRDGYEEQRHALNILNGLGLAGAEAELAGLFGTRLINDGALVEARDILDSALNINIRLGNAKFEGHCLISLAQIDLEEGKFNESREKLMRVIAHHRVHGQQEMQGYGLSWLGLWSLESKDYRVGCAAFDDALALLNDQDHAAVCELIEAQYAVLLAHAGDHTRSSAIGSRLYCDFFLRQQDQPSSDGLQSNRNRKVIELCKAELDLLASARMRAKGATVEAADLRKSAEEILDNILSSPTRPIDPFDPNIRYFSMRLAARRIQRLLDQDEHSRPA